jgi:hypothetical protein
MTNQGKSLAGRTSKHDVDMPAAYPSPLPYFFSGQPDNRSRQHSALRKIVCVHSAMDWIDLNCGNNIETSLLEAQSKASSASEQVDSDQSWHLRPPVFKYQITGFCPACRSEFFLGVPKRK